MNPVWPVNFLIRLPDAISQSMIDLSSPADAIKRPLGETATVLIEPVWPVNTRTQEPVWTSHRREVRSLEPVTIYLELGWNLTV